MPFYRVPGLGVVHIKVGRGSKLPRPCVALIGIEGRRERCGCGSSFLCDHDVGEGKTCDAPLCERHANQVGKNRHLCPRHFAAYREREPELFNQVENAE